MLRSLPPMAKIHPGTQNFMEKQIFIVKTLAKSDSKKTKKI